MSKHRIEKEGKCAECKATGLYVGIAERDGAAVVCSRCKGSGKVLLVLEWEDFEGREERKGVGRVFQTNPGICIGQGKERESGREFRLSDFGGMSYSQWKEGRPFERGMENRKFTCPAWWYQSADYERKPAWDECLGCGAFSSCKHFPDKAACWVRFDKEGL